MYRKTKAIRKRTNRINRLVEEVSREKDFIVSVEDYQYAELPEDKEAVRIRRSQLLLEFCQRYILIFQNDVQTIMLENKDFLEKSLENSIEANEISMFSRDLRKVLDEQIKDICKQWNKDKNRRDFEVHFICMIKICWCFFLQKVYGMTGQCRIDKSPQK